jgi:hypothetical protein
MSGFISTAVTFSDPAARATSTSEPPPGPMMSVFGFSGATLKGSARYHSRIPATLATLPSHSRMFVQASESM